MSTASARGHPLVDGVGRLVGEHADRAHHEHAGDVVQHRDGLAQRLEQPGSGCEIAGGGLVGGGQGHAAGGRVIQGEVDQDQRQPALAGHALGRGPAVGQGQCYPAVDDDPPIAGLATAEGDAGTLQCRDERFQRPEPAAGHHPAGRGPCGSARCRPLHVLAVAVEAAAGLAAEEAGGDAGPAAARDGVKRGSWKKAS